MHVQYIPYVCITECSAVLCSFEVQEKLEAFYTGGQVQVSG